MYQYLCNEGYLLPSFLGMVADARSQVQRARYEVKYMNPSNSVAVPGSGIGCLFDPWIRDPDPGWEKVSIRIRDPG